MSGKSVYINPLFHFQVAVLHTVNALSSSIFANSYKKAPGLAPSGLFLGLMTK